MKGYLQKTIAPGFSTDNEFFLGAYYTKNRLIVAPTHHHTHYELVFCLDGQCESIIEGQHYPLRKGDFILVCPNVSHAVHCQPGIGYKQLVFSFSPNHMPHDRYPFTSPVIENALFNITSLGRYRYEHSPLSVPVAQTLLELFKWQSRTETADRDMQMHSLFYKLVGFLIRGYVKDADMLTPIQTAAHKKIKNICYQIQNDFCKNYSLEQMAALTNYTPNYFSRIFKEATGLNFKAYVDNVKINKAEHLIRNDHYSVKETSEILNYSSPYAFNRTFKRIKGYPPSQIKASKSTQHQKNDSQ